MVVVMAVAIALGGAAACGEGSEPVASTEAIEVTEPVVPGAEGVTTTTAPVSDEEAVRLAYAAAYEAYFLAAGSPEAEHQLSATWIGPALARAEGRLADLADAGQRAQVVGNKLPKTTVLDVRIDGDTAKVKSCDIDDSIVISVDDGLVVRSEPEARLVTSNLSRHSTGWKVHSTETLHRWRGETRCLKDR